MLTGEETGRWQGKPESLAASLRQTSLTALSQAGGTNPNPPHGVRSLTEARTPGHLGLPGQAGSRRFFCVHLRRTLFQVLKLPR